MGRLDDKVTLVTGGGRGLGAAIARRFHEAGASVVVNDLHLDTAEKVASDVDGIAIGADVTDADAVRVMFEEVASRCGRLDVLVNNAGISGLEGRSDEVERRAGVLMQQGEELMNGGPVVSHLDVTVEHTDDDWHRVLAVHLNGTFFCTREALRMMGPQGSGSIVNLGSIMGTAGGAGTPAYCAAKAGILGLTRSVAREVVSRGIRVNAIAPGWIETDMTDVLGSMLPFIAAQTPMGCLGEPDDIAWAAVYLASDEAKFVTGQVLSPNGGWHMSQ